MFKKLLHFRAAFLLLGSMLLSVLGYSQGITTSTISGVVTDSKGEGLPGATVIAIHEPSGSRYGITTNAQGRYTIPSVRVGGPYTMTVSYVGFQEQKLSGLTANLGSTANADFRLSEQGAQLNEVVVTGTRNSIISSDRTGASTGIVREQIQALPTLNRSFQDLTRLTPQANGNSFAGRNSGFNNITIDGALFNNAFGLSGTVGGQSNAQPISLDAVDQISINLAPYDVREGSFTGAGVNIVSRAGTNDYSGSVYYFTRNQNYIGKKVGDITNEVSNFNLNNVGFRIGGPIIKNKLFFFANYERERRNDPPTPTFRANRGEPSSTAGVSTARASTLDSLRSFLISKYGFDPGAYEGYQLASNSDKANIRLDWNISDKHKLALKYNRLTSYRDVSPSTSGALAGGRNPSATNLPYLTSFYRINNNFDIFIAELNSTFSNTISNKFQVGYSAFRDFRETPLGSVPFPLVDIGNGSGQSLTSFGSEPFSANNILNSDVFQISDNVDIFAGKHTFTVGTYNEFYKFQNGFAPNFYGQYQFNSVQDFYNSANNGVSNARQYQQRYSAVANVNFPFAYVNASQLGFYVQDKYEVRPNLNLTLGLRADVPIINTDVARNNQTAERVFRDGERIYTDQVPKSSVLFSPRLGFNWDVKGDRTLQVRGGSGIFTGRVPFVWISNQASNNGLLFNSELLSNPANRPFNPDVNAYRPTSLSAAASYNLAVTDPNFKFPQVWRTNLAIDKQLGGGLVATLEAAYTKDLNAVYHVNAILPTATNFASGADNRPIFYTASNVTVPIAASAINNRIYSNITDAVIMKNTNQGYSYFVTAKLEKTFSRNFYASAAYTYTDAKSVNDGGSIAQSIWRDRQVSGDPNENVLARTQFLQRHRIVAAASYSFEWLKAAKTTISAFYEAGPVGYFSYVYSGDMNGDGAGGNNDLIFVPASRDQIVLSPIGSGTATYSADAQWNDLNNYIEQDSYLRTRRGQYAERNGAELPWRGQLDVRVLQDLFVNIGGKRNSLQISLDLFNFGNMLNPDWGVFKTINRPALLTFRGYDATRRPVYQFPFQDNATRTVLTSTYQNSVSPASRWQAQLGIRYIFN